MSIPWNEPATVDMYARGLDRRRAAFTGTLRDAVIYTLSQANSRGDGYIIRLDDGSTSWEGGQIAALGRQL